MQELELLSTIGFSGTVRNGLHLHPNKQHVIYPLGSTIVVEKLGGKKNQKFLQGHSDTVTTIAISPTGRYIASGQQTHQGYAADILLWDFETMELKHRMTLHQVVVSDLTFSPTEKFLLSLGGEDDGKLAIWDVFSGKALSAAPTSDISGGHANVVKFCNGDDFTFVSGGKYTIRVWTIKPRQHTLTPTNCALRSLRRIITSVAISDDDEFAYFGTTSGDIVSISIPHKVLKGTGPQKSKYAGGVTSIALSNHGDIIVGSGNGTIALCSPSSFKPKQETTVVGSITSISLGDKDMFVGTTDADIYRVDQSDVSQIDEWKVCHPHGVYDLDFTRESDDLFSTCSDCNVRVWHTPTGKQLLNINVPGVKCNTMCFSPDGKLIITGWADGVIRAFLPQSAKEKFEIQNAHKNGVTSVAMNELCDTIISGGGDGLVRVWSISEHRQTLLESMKEHKSAVTDIRIKSNGKECVSASQDGSCVIWDLDKYIRSQVLMGLSSVSQVRYRPDEAQLVTCCADGKVLYWEAYDGSLLRELEVSASGPLNGIDVSSDGETIVVGGADKLLKLLTYSEGETTYVGAGHGGNITRVAISPNMKYVISVTETGSIFRWKFPL
eukprot:m.7868 g.7868  ORF g.7868 m.7868 type:complete len:609 (+) comp2942_c0_seq1:68-1894(+)